MPRRKPPEYKGMFSAALWKELRDHYETGLSESVKELTIEFKRKYGRSPSDSAISKRIRKEKWVKDSRVVEIAEKIENENERLFIEAGVTRLSVIKIMGDIIQDENTDKRTRMEYIKEYNKLVGSLAPAKRALDVTSQGEKITAPILFLPQNDRK